jgi:hypothetical protein
MVHFICPVGMEIVLVDMGFSGWGSGVSGVHYFCSYQDSLWHILIGSSVLLSRCLWWIV